MMIMKVKEWCMYCGECAGVCPRSLIEVGENSLKFDKDNCKECAVCIQVCPVQALAKEEVE
jgi:ferredoxin